MPLLLPARNTTVFPIWMQAIRGKIIDDADRTLELYGASIFDWNEIKSTLITHFGDKRDESSLTRDLFKLTQEGSVIDFYKQISHNVALIVNIINLNQDNPIARTALIEKVREHALRAFIAGLKDPLGPIIRAQRPSDLKEALRFCLEETNMNYVKNASKMNSSLIQLKHPPQIPPRFQSVPQVPTNANTTKKF